MAEISKLTLGSGEYNLKDPIARRSIGYAQVDSTSTSTAYTAQIDGITSYFDGLAIMLRNGVVTSEAGFTIDINGIGAKPVYNNMKDLEAESTLFNIAYTMLFVYDSTRVTGGCWILYRGYNSDTTSARGLIDYYFRPQAGSATYRYKLCMMGANNRLYPIVMTDQEDSTQVAKAPQTVGLKPHKIWFYNGTTTISAGSAFGAQTLYEAMYTTGAYYNFNTTISKYTTIFLRGTYNKDTDLFTLYDDGNSPCTSYYTTVPTNSSSITLSSYFVQGYYYILVGGSYSSNNYFSLFVENPMYYFDGTNLIPVATKLAQDSAGVKSLDGETGDLYLLNTTIGSAYAGPDVSATAVTSWVTNTPTEVGFNYVVTGGTSSSISVISSVGTAASASYSSGILTITNGTAPSFGTAVSVYTGLTTDLAGWVTPGTAATLSYSQKYIPTTSFSSVLVVTDISTSEPARVGSASVGDTVNH